MRKKDKIGSRSNTPASESQQGMKAEKGQDIYLIASFAIKKTTVWNLRTAQINSYLLEEKYECMLVLFGCSI